MLDMLQVLRGLRPVIMVLFLAPLLACSDRDEKPLRIGMIPDAGATQVSIEEKAPLQEYLAKRLDRPVELIIPTNYAATVEAIGNGSLDIAYFGGLTYAKAHARYGAVPLVQRDIDQRFHSLFIAHVGSGIAKLTDLHGKSFCFGDVNSTSGHLIPRLVLEKAGVSVEIDLESSRHTGSHPATAHAVASGACDAGALDETVYRSLVEEHKLDPAQVSIFFTSPPFTDYVWAARKDLPEADRKAFSEALLGLAKGRDEKVLDILRGEKFVPARNESYSDVVKIARELKLL